MDTWLIAQCMSRLPRLTYFSHSESSLDDFLRGEANTIMYAGDRVTPVVQQGTSAHELQFLRSLRQSLGNYVAIENDGVTESQFGHNDPSHSDFLASADTHSDAIAEGHATSKLLSDYFSLKNKSSEMLTSLYGPSVLPFAGTSATSNLNQGESAEPRSTLGAGSECLRYQCYWEDAVEQPCGEWIDGGSKEVWTHVRKAHGLKGHYSGWCLCKWSGCLEKLKVSSLRRHLARHLDIRWRCSNCGVIFARCDYVRRHIKMTEECHGASYAADLDK